MLVLLRRQPTAIERVALPSTGVKRGAHETRSGLRQPRQQPDLSARFTIYIYIYIHPAAAAILHLGLLACQPACHRRRLYTTIVFRFAESSSASARPRDSPTNVGKDEGSLLMGLTGQSKGQPKAGTNELKPEEAGKGEGELLNATTSSKGTCG